MEVPIKNKTGEIIASSLVDEEDYIKVNSVKWALVKGYATSHKYGRMHRFIMNANKDDLPVDHINGNKLDNTKANLQFVTVSQNNQNKSKKEGCTSKYKGVCYDEKNNKWICSIVKEGKTVTKSFSKEEHAAWMYNKLALELFGPNSKINEINKPLNFVNPIEKEKLLPTGVTKTPTGKFVANITYKKQIHYLGTFVNVDDEKRPI